MTQPIEVLARLAEERVFTDEEVNTLRDIRRRGKNLIAAHNCRNRKIGEVEVREVEVQSIRDFGLGSVLQELRMKVREAKRNLEKSKKYHLYLLKHKANLTKKLDQYGKKYNQHFVQAHINK